LHSRQALPATQGETLSGKRIVVAEALQGQYRGALRTRVRDKPPPPIYS